MTNKLLQIQTAEFAEVIRRFVRMRARLNVVQPEDLTKLMTLLDASNPSGQTPTKGDYNLLFSVGMILSNLGPIAMGELSRALDVPFSTATRIVDWLVATNFVERTHDPADRRIVHVDLTESGRNMLRIHNDYMCLRIMKLLQHFTSEERLNLLTLMRKLASALEEEGS
jgi:DNA-binding MarR family transcriptional regulator